MKPLDEKALEAAAHVLHSQQELDYDWDRERDAFRSQAAEIIRAYIAALDPAPGWMPIETAPYRKRLDLWCIHQHERRATWPVRGQMVPDRFKDEKYGWFGNQSNDGIPQGRNPDLVPVAWRPHVECPAELIAPFLPAAPMSQEG